MKISLSSRSQKRSIGDRLVNGGIWMLVGRLSTLILGIVVSGLLARLLSPHNMGVFVFVESLVLTAGIFAQFGLGHTAVRLIARSAPHSTTAYHRKIVLSVLQLGLFGALLAALLLALLGSALGLAEGVLVWASIWVFIFAVQHLIADLFRGFHDFRSVVLIAGSKTGGVISTGIAAILLFLLWNSRANSDLLQIFPFLLAGSVPAIILGVIALSRRLQLSEGIGRETQEEEPELSRSQLLRLSFPLLITAVTAIMLNRSGVWVVTAFRPSSEVAIFGVVARLVIIISLPMNFFETLMSPTIAELYSSGHVKRLEKLLRGTTTFLALFAVSVLIMFVFFGGDILSLINGEFYRAGAPVLVLLVVGSIASVLTGPCGMTLVMAGKQKTLMVIDIVSTVFSLVLMLTLVQVYGVLGVATAIAIGTVSKNLAMLIITRRLTGIWTHLTLNFADYRDLSWLREIRA